MPEHIQHDYAIGMTWRIKDSLPERRLVYYGKVIAGRPSFIARDLLGAFLRLRVEPGGYRKLYAKGGLSHCGKLGDGHAQQARRGRDAGVEVVERLRAAVAPRGVRFSRDEGAAGKISRAQGWTKRADPFSYVWDTMEHRWPDAIAEARPITRSQRAYVIVRRIFETTGFGSERTVSRLLGIDQALVESAARKLEREGVIVRGARIDGHPGAVSILSSLKR